MAIYVNDKYRIAATLMSRHLSNLAVFQRVELFCLPDDKMRIHLLSPPMSV